MKDKVIVITGSSSGIGKYLSEYFSLNNTVIGLCRSGGENAIVCDISSNSDLDNAVEQIKTKYGKVDMLINNAGYGLTGACEMLSDEEIKKIFDVDLMGAIYLTKRILPLMDRGAKIINISSACALFPLPYRTMYCSVKAGMNLWSQGLTMEVKDAGIQVTSICPGDIKTPFTTNRKSDYATNERYGDAMQRADKKVENKYNSRMELDYAGSIIAKICKKKKLKPMYIVGAKYKILYFLKRIFPLSTFMYFTSKLMVPKGKK